MKLSIYYNLLTPFILLLILLSAFKNGKPTCDRYFINILLYVVLCITLLINSLYIEGHFKIMERILSKYITSIFRVILFMIVVIIISIVLILAMQYTESQLVKHMLLATIILLFGLLSYGLYEEKYKVGKLTEFKDTFIRLICILIFVCALAYYYPNFFTNNIYKLLIVLCGISTLLYIIDIVLIRSEYTIYFIYLFIVFFSLFLVYSIKDIIKERNNCTNPDYIFTSFDGFSNILIIFNDLLKLSD